jgi:N-6 DNA Methylase
LLVIAGDESENGEARATERRLSGSYYTHDALVQELLRRSLHPLIDHTLHENPTEPRRALLGLRLVDPACGSGHFLLGAARRLAAEVARLESEGDLPDETLRRRALREVVQHCIYGVDRNPLAVELCRTALWIETIEPGKPLSFLDAHIRCGDALVGVTNLGVLGEGIPDEAFVPFVRDDSAAASVFKRMNKLQRESPHTLDLGISLPEDLASSLAALSDEAEDSVEVIEDKRRRLQELRSTGIAWRLRNACDLWTAAFFVKKVAPDIKGRELCPSTDAVWRYLRGTTLYGPLITETDRLAQYYRFFIGRWSFPTLRKKAALT